MSDPQSSSTRPSSWPVCDAIVPAAGHSRRMGADKLMMRLQGKPLLEHALQAWLDSRVRRIAVVVRKSAPARVEWLEEYSRREPRVVVVVPEIDPPDMRASVQAGLRFIQSDGRATPIAWLVAPADMPGLTASAIDPLLANFDSADVRIRVAMKSGKRGHPVMFPWTLLDTVLKLGEAESLKAVVEGCGYQAVEVSAADIHHDIDTPEDFRNVTGVSPPVVPGFKPDSA